MTGLALACPVGVFPDQRVSVSPHTMRAAQHTVGAIFKMGALGTLVWTLQGDTASCIHVKYSDKSEEFLNNNLDFVIYGATHDGTQELQVCFLN